MRESLDRSKKNTILTAISIILAQAMCTQHIEIAELEREKANFLALSRLLFSIVVALIALLGALVSLKHGYVVLFGVFTILFIVLVIVAPCYYSRLKRTVVKNYKQLLICYIMLIILGITLVFVSLRMLLGC
mgnify:FL=1